MQKNLVLLEELQRMDLRIDGHNAAKLKLQEEMAALDAKIAEARAAKGEREEALAALEEEKRALEENLETEADNITRSDARLKEIKTQKEYQAVSKEISAARKLKAELEEQVLQRISRIEELRAEITTQEETLGELEKGVDAEKGERQVKIDELDRVNDGDLVEREKVAKGLSASTVKRYEALRERRQGLAVVEARDGSCLGCNMNLPPQTYNNMYKLNELITCPHCQRMLFLRDQLT
ncbi:MAG: hypothetical protein HYS23_09125 [Geobacter sp.]|nr:hypothetical protein [Geobacter sp.]